MVIEAFHQAGVTIVRLQGPVEGEPCKPLLREMFQVVEAFGPQPVVLDLAGVSGLGFTGVRFLIMCLTEARARGQVLALAGMRDECRRLFKFTGALELFPSFPSIDEAMGYCMRAQARFAPAAGC